MRGSTFEYIAKIILRRERKNNFIFQVSQHDGTKEIIRKYGIKESEEIVDKLVHIECGWGKFDLVEFVLNNKEERVIKDIIVYEVKSKIGAVERNYFELCQSNYAFLESCKERGYEVKILSIILFEDWRFSFNIKEYADAPIRVYSRYKGKEK